MIDDVVLERAPVSESLARDMLARLRLVRHAGRTAPAVDLAAAARFVGEFSRLAATAPWPRFVLEVNPIRVSEEGAVAVDGLLVIDGP